jgi:hypothetical protein
MKAGSMAKKRVSSIDNSAASDNGRPHTSSGANARSASGDALEFYLESLELLNRSRIPYLVGGAYALQHYADIVRHTKDLDIFVRRTDVRRVIRLFERHGSYAELIFPHWLGKVFNTLDPTAFVDVIFGSGNGLCRVDDGWFDHAVEGEVFGLPARLVPAEEMIWSKAFICERERYDGADILHLIQARGKALDWPRLLGRFAGHEQVLLSHLFLFDYVYPDDRDRVPMWVFDQLTKAVRTGREMARTSRRRGKLRICRGTFLSREQYLCDIHRRGYEDARLKPHGPMRLQDVEHWTRAIGKSK